MYIVAIAWMYVVVLMAATQETVLSALGTLLFYGVVPCSVVMYIIMAPSRARRKKAQAAAEQAANASNSEQPTSQTDL
jgi:hypothetical protein